MRVQWLLIALLAMGSAAGCTAIQPGATSPLATAMPATEVAVDPMLTVTAAATTTLTATVTSTVTAPITSTMTPTATTPVSATPTVTATAPITATSVPTATQAPTTTLTPTATQPMSGTPTLMPSATPTGTAPVETPTASPGTPGTPSPSPTTGPTATPTPPATPTAPPTATFTPGPSPTPTPLPATVFIRNHRGYAEGSSYFVVGEAVNGGPAPVYSLRVIATFYDAGGRLIGAQETMALLPQTQPTQANPFKVQLTNAPGGIQRYDLALAWDEISIAEFDRVTVAREEVRAPANEMAGVEIVGDLRNDHRDEIRNITVVATFYDAGGAVLDVVPGSAAATTLAPGAMTTFSVQTSRPIDYASYLIQTEGMIFR
ncbi:MAG: hypothetical protein IT329_07310 [Caldilineaceae bacterium]|nr:hypothetical protein [Caldilineaceae bacterium]